MPLSGDTRVDFENDLSAADASFSAFHLTARSAVRSGGLELEAGDRVTYRVPALTEMLFQLGSTMAGRRFALGRLFVLGGASEAGRIYPVAAFEDVILGRSLAPVLAIGVHPAGRNAVAVDAANASAHASIAFAHRQLGRDRRRAGAPGRRGAGRVRPLRHVRP